MSVAVTAGPAAPDLGQGWNDQNRDFFWYANQGSRLIPRDWFLALEREDSQELFLADSLTRFGYLAAPAPSASNPDRLPIGFAVDHGRTPTPARNRAWIGMTCAACHTSEISRGDIKLRIEGAPADADMYAFLVALDRALTKAAHDDAAFDRFAVRVLGAGSSPEARLQLRDGPDGLRRWAGGFSLFVQQSKANTVWGPRRLDAFGMIFNRVTSIDLGIRENSQPPDAPVSYPFLWGTTWHDYTQWTGSVPNSNFIARLSRNVGQVLGVFGTLDVKPERGGYPSSAQSTLLALEATVGKLKAPEWPVAVFGAPEAQRLARGERLYSINCAGCHTIVPRDKQLDPGVRVTRVSAAKVGTDETTARMAAERISQTGVLKDRKLLYLLGRNMAETELSADILTHAVFGALSGSLRPSASAGREPAKVEPLFDGSVRNVNYKARPLNGIWATAPYLHNGSVRTLRQLLLPPQQREETFLVGSREFDPAEVGFVSAGAAGAAQPFLFDTRIRGNSNQGHVYGTSLADGEKADLLEFLKTL